MRMVILLWVTMATPPWLSTAWGLWVGLAGAGTHAPVNTGAHTQVDERRPDCASFRLAYLSMKQHL